MTPREKANHLINEFYDNNTDYIDSNKDAKECAITSAIICVEKIIEINPNISFWHEVKLELENQ